MNEYLKKFDTIKFIATWSIFKNFFWNFLFFEIQIWILNLGRFRTGPNRNRPGPITPVTAVSGPVPVGKFNPGHNWSHKWTRGLWRKGTVEQMAEFIGLWDGCTNGLKTKLYPLQSILIREINITHTTPNHHYHKPIQSKHFKLWLQSNKNPFLQKKFIV